MGLTGSAGGITEYWFPAIGDVTSGSVLAVVNGELVWINPGGGGLGYVPYTGATAAVDLGGFDLSATLLTSTALTSGSVVFAGTGGLLSQDNTNFSWDDVNKKQYIGGRLNVYKTSGNAAIFGNSTTAPFDAHVVDIIASGTNTPLMCQGGSGSIEFWKDGTPTKAIAFGMAKPGDSVSDDFVVSAYNGSSWNENMRVATATGIMSIQSLTASRAMVTDGSKNLTSSATTATEIGYVSGVTSGIQGQIDSKFTLPALTAGSVLFSDGSTITQDNTNFFWDNANNRLGLGTNAPAVALDILTTDLNAIKLTCNPNFTTGTAAAFNMPYTQTGNVTSFAFKDGNPINVTANSSGTHSGDGVQGAMTGLNLVLTHSDIFSGGSFFGVLSPRKTTKGGVLTANSGSTQTATAGMNIDVTGLSLTSFNADIPNAVGQPFTLTSTGLTLSTSITTTSTNGNITRTSTGLNLGVGLSLDTANSTAYGILLTMPGLTTGKSWSFHSFVPQANMYHEGKITVGSTTNISAKMNITSTTEQQRLYYDASNYFSTTVGTTGAVTFDAVGSGAKFTFSDSVDLRTGSATAETYPLKFTSGALLTTPVVGVEEFLTDKRYTTITTGTARKEYTLNDIALTSGRVPFATTNGRLTDDADFTFATDTLSYAKGLTNINTYTAGSGGTTDGMSWNDTTQKSHAVYQAGIKQMLSGCIFTQTADKTIANTVTETTLFGTGVGTLTLPANFWVAGKTVRVTISGDFANTGTPTARIKVKFGATTLIDSTALAIPALAGTEQWDMHIIITCRTAGVTGTLETNVIFEYETTTGVTPIERFDISGTSTVVDTTGSGALDATFQWGTASSSNTITSEIALIEVLN